MRSSDYSSPMEATVPSNISVSHGISVISAGLTEDKEESCLTAVVHGAGIDLATQQATPEASQAMLSTRSFSSLVTVERAQGQLSTRVASHASKQKLLTASSRSCVATPSARSSPPRRARRLYPPPHVAGGEDALLPQTWKRKQHSCLRGPPPFVTVPKSQRTLTQFPNLANPNRLSPRRIAKNAVRL